MIGWLSGTLRAKHPPLLVLDVQGVGYEVEAPMTTFYDLPEIDRPLALFTHHVVREDASLLYGFIRESDRGLFRQLIRVNGVGPKMALGILSGMTATEFAHCVRGEDSTSLTRLPGVGRKTAERLIIEMRDRLDAGLTELDGASAPARRGEPADDPRQEAVAALVALGYKPADAGRRVQAVPTELSSVEAIIRHALQAAG